MVAPLIAFGLQRAAFFWAGFDGDVHETVPLGAEWTRSHLRRWPLTQAEADATVGFFSPWGGAPAKLGKFRLSLYSRGRWLDVDSEGIAIRDGRRGRFDVLGFARFVNSSPHRTRLFGSVSLLRVRVVNRGRPPVVVRSGNGLCGARVAPSASASFVTWAAWHTVSDGRRVAQIPDDFSIQPTDPWAVPWLHVYKSNPHLVDVRSQLRTLKVSGEADYKVVIED